MKYFVGLMLLTILASVSPGFACSMVKRDSQQADVDAGKYIFIGRVTGYKEGIRAAESRYGTATAVLVEPIGIVNAPVRPEKHFEIVLIEAADDCSPVGLDANRLKRDYPVGAEYRIEIGAARVFSVNVAEGVVRLENGPDDYGLSPNGDYLGGLRSDVDEEFDYRQIAGSKSASMWPRMKARFEITKDLFRLRAASSVRERRPILKRLKHARRDVGYDIGAILKKYGK